jgi:DNA-binding beta-propeller fold protein YncE
VRGCGAFLVGRLVTALECIWAALVLSAALPASAGAADSIYWGTGSVPGAIRVGNLDGSGIPSSLLSGESAPQGVAIDPAAGRIYWADAGSTSSSGAVRVANLDGSSPSTLFTDGHGPSGVAIDPAAGKIYWSDAFGAAIRVGSLNGGSPSYLFTGEGSPRGVAIDPAAGKIYWADNRSGAIRVGNLNGSGTPSSLFTGESNPYGVAIDPASGKIYWADSVPGAIRVGNLDGTGSPSSLFTGNHNPTGIAVDPAAGKIYWTDFGTGAIWVGNIDGQGAGTLFTGESDLAFLALLRAPGGTGAPQITGGYKLGSTLSCSQGEWASDLTGAFLFHAPQTYSYQWLDGGTPIPGATSSTYMVTRFLGLYQCRVTATNAGGSTSQTSPYHSVLTIPPHTLVIGTTHNFNRGWAELVVHVPLPGTLLLSGKRILAQRITISGSPTAHIAGAIHHPGTVTLVVKAKGRAKRLLDRTGKLRVKVKITYKPQGGLPSVLYKNVSLVKKPTR